MIQKAENVDLILASAGNKTTYTGFFVSVMGWLTATNAIGLIGALLTVIGVIANLYYRRKDNARKAAAEARAEADSARDAANDLRKEKEHELRMELMRQRGYILHAPETKIEAEASDA